MSQELPPAPPAPAPAIENFNWNMLLQTLEQSDHNPLKQMMGSHRFELISQADEKGFNLLHHAVLGGMPKKVEIILKHQENRGVSDEELKAWVNSVTGADKFTPLHLASFKGNMDAIRILEKYGANIHALNGFGLNMLHVAAQGDVAPPLYYFKEKGVDLNLQDHRGSTPLHWACYSNSEIALSYLLAWGPNLNIRDKDGYTPLHLAVKSVDTVESTRPVRFLLIRGADKDITDEEQKKPIDHVEDEVSSQRLQNELKKMLGNPRLCDCLMLSTPTRLVHKKPTTQIMYVAIIVTVVTLETLFVFPYLRLWNVAINVSVLVLCLIFFSITSFMKPGYLVNHNVDFMDMLENVESTQLCPDCKSIRTSRSRHCSVCRCCVERFDHHCPWINNCVGLRNHNYFYCYILCQTLVILITLAQSIHVFIMIITNTTYKGNDIFEFSFNHYETSRGVKWLDLIFVTAVVIMTGFFCLPLSYLLYVQTQNFVHGKTTMERFGRVGQDNDREGRIMNSGIEQDTQIYRQSISRVNSFQGNAYPSGDDEPGEAQERLLTAGSRVSEMSYQNDIDLTVSANQRRKEQRQQLRTRDKNLTNMARRQNTCWAMCMQRKARSQQEIYNEHLVMNKFKLGAPLD